MDRDIIKIKVCKEVSELIKYTSKTLAIPISQILRNVLMHYKNNGESIDKDCYDDYSTVLYVVAKENFTSKEYQEFGDKISNEDIINILKKLYSIDLYHQ